MFERKVEELFTARSQKAFDELVTEFGVAALLSQCASPILWEPYVPEGADSAAQPPSPDFAVRLPDGDIAIEVTVLYVDQLSAWERHVGELIRVLQVRLDKLLASREFEFYVPIDFDRRKATSLIQRSTLRPVFEHEEGELRVDVGTAEAILRWRPHTITYVNRLEDFDLSAVSPAAQTGVVVIGGATIGASMGIKYAPIDGAKTLSDLFLDSIRNTLKRKRKQHVGTDAYLLAVRLGHPRLTRDQLFDLLDFKIWPNPVFDWITGVLDYAPFNCATGVVDPGPQLTALLNPGAAKSASASLVDVLDGNQQFHLP